MIKRGSKVRVVKMDTAGGMDWQAKRLEGKIFTVRLIDSAGQIHLEETGLALIPGVDQFLFPSHPSETQEDDQDSPKNIAECICNQGRPECSLEGVLFPEHKMIYQELDKDGED